MTRAPRTRRLIATLVTALMAVAVVAPGVTAKQPKDPVKIQILGLNDFHGTIVKFGADDLVALEAYLASHDPYNPASDTAVRVTKGT